MTAVISVEGLVKSFGPTRALAGLDLEVQPGEVHGFLGPNGAGKSTTLRTLMGLLRADGGRAALFGQDPWHDAVALHRRLAYVPGDVELWPTLTGGEVIDLLARMRGETAMPRRAELIERFSLDPGKRSHTYSTGNRQKVALVAAFASEAELLVLDEPTSGLDPLMELVFQDEVERARNQGRTVLLSSHILAEVERLADHLSIVRDGVTVESGTLAEMRHLSGTSVGATTAAPVTGLDTLDGVTDLEQDETTARFHVAPDALDAVMTHLTRFGIVALHSAPASLEELMLRHYDAGHDDRSPATTAARGEAGRDA
ncbi:ABC transporter ATP-binding protein [Brachybacterium fresconis]|uniref:ABC-2 type transport system ATP-binding protein n=1 Tax=Brachybacterium fresconis TaxID=173363 RepID=A0ABS4YIL7_9MICO|nr:ABC transporter ATP-binding protein [Brachybacterium fresconis]MBP2407743.1 ABC-2 type transport system ATP-binding protein [Brachybacterium fresconis]